MRDRQLVPVHGETFTDVFTAFAFDAAHRVTTFPGEPPGQGPGLNP